MVRNGLGVDARGGRVRAASATNSKVLVVIDDAPLIDVGEALRAALASARAKFGEPDAIALVHDDDLPDANRAELVEQARAAGLGEVRLVADSVARPYAEHEDLPPALVAAAGAAIWLLRERRGVIVPPLLPPQDQPDESGRRMDDFGAGRQMSDFGAGDTMSDHGNGRQMNDFGAGRTMAAFGAGATMSDHAGAPPRRRTRLIVAAVAAAVVVVAAAVAAVGLTGPSTDADRVAATDTTERDNRDEGEEEAGDEREDSEGSDSETTTTAALEPGALPSTTVATPTGDATATTKVGAPSVGPAGGTPTTTSTTVSSPPDSAFAAGTTRTYDVLVTKESMEDVPHGAHPFYQAPVGTTERGTALLSCSDKGCFLHITVPAWDDPQFPNESGDYTGEFVTPVGPVVDGHLRATQELPPPGGCAETGSDTVDSDLTETTVVGTLVRDGWACPDGNLVGFAISFRSP